MSIEFIKVKSSNIDSYCYNDGDLYIKFKTGIVYKYDKVEKAIVDSFITAESKGSYLHKLISKNYKYSIIE